jgi:hypothetical protein
MLSLEYVELQEMESASMFFGIEWEIFHEVKLIFW